MAARRKGRHQFLTCIHEKYLCRVNGIAGKTVETVRTVVQN